MRKFIALAATVGTAWLVLSGATTPAMAHDNCYEVIGCPHIDTFHRGDLRQLSCQNLWYIRNRIYDDHGFCFKTAAGRREFDNSDCYVDNAANVKMNRRERQNITLIQRVERERGC